ncbi:uncharacterized protein NPIL_96141 [Nephila pilipes]|uniref:Uncharacterized protein n=1 Tax=Nephila pilipes TaxID=299642 RepID=A0A8X6Q0J4_NEPPI|nr:uncharacterized protein NPIL_96141 [Nephila pilipes]
MHNVENINELRRKYALCTHESSKEEMLIHFQEVYDVKIENVEFSFINFEAFNEWKNRTEKESAYNIKFCKTHQGHRNDIGHLSLTEYEQRHIATKIASKIPFEEILDEIRDSVTDSKLERIHLLTKKKDLYNIENCFNIGSNAIKHKDDGTSVDAWVNEMESKNDLCILFYKPQGVASAMYPELKSDDFVLIIMNDAQCEVLK